MVKFEPSSEKSNNTASVARMLTSISRSAEMNELISTCWHQLGWSVKVLMACDDSPALFFSHVYTSYTQIRAWSVYTKYILHIVYVVHILWLLNKMDKRFQLHVLTHTWFYAVKGEHLVDGRYKWPVSHEERQMTAPEYRVEAVTQA